MLSLSRGSILAAMFLLAPATASAQVVGGGFLPGVGIGFGTQQQLGPPPAGVMLHQQYMQLYGLPTSFLQGTVNNGGGAGVFPGYGGFGGGYGGFPRYFGVNYQRNMAALQALQMYQQQAALQQAYAAGYGMNPYAAQAPAANPYAGTSFGSYSAGQQPQFAQSALTTRTTPTFGGFGLNNTANPFITNGLKKDDKKEDKRD
jgi:hypothetical protein